MTTATITIDDLNAAILPEMENLHSIAGILETLDIGYQARFDRAVDNCWTSAQEHFDFSDEDIRRAFEDAMIAAIEPIAPNVAADWRSNQGYGACSYPWSN